MTCLCVICKTKNVTPVVLNDFPNVVFQANQKRLFLIIVTVTQIRMGESKKATLPVFIQ